MGSFQIEGGHKLNGAITPQGAKMRPYKFYVPYYLLTKRLRYQISQIL